TNGTLEPGEQRQLLGLIHALPAHSTPELDRRSRLANEAFQAHDWSGQKTYEQSYWLAAWLREQLGLDSQTPADPEAWLGEWGVEVREEALPAPIDALAVWGERHGPAILLNTTEGAYPAQPAGRRITLAHEIAHLLIDRERALPAAELVKIGGQDLAPATPEVRARAFAAELLLPRETAAQYVQDRSSLDEAIGHLVSDFGVGPQVAGWQIRNSSAGTALSPAEQRTLEALLSRTPVS
ncbi:MAG: ImmA/IrrE family metallo-endopeptidase, partial [Thiohalorhabdaceae bacterium]